MVEGARSKVLDLLRTLVKAAVDDHVIDRNPIASFKPGKDDRYHAPERRVWTPAQVQTFLRAAEGDPLAPLLQVAVLHGLRRGELLGLRWSDINFDTSTLHVRQQVGWIDGQPTTADVKTRESRRSFTLDDDTLAVLRRHRDAQVVRDLRWNLVFTQEDGTPLRPYEPLFTLKRIADAAGLPRRTLHELRHTAITNMLAQGVPPKVVSRRAGHTNVGFTLTAYAHVLPEQDQDAAARIGGILARDLL